MFKTSRKEKVTFFILPSAKIAHPKVRAANSWQVSQSVREQAGGGPRRFFQRELATSLTDEEGLEG